MKVIIGVWHTESKGRRSTLREFAKVLIEKHPFAEIISFEQNGQTIKEVPNSGDFCLVLKIKDKTISIECKIDSCHKPLEKLQKLAKDCDIIVCATKEKGITTDAVEEMKFENFIIIWTSTYHVTEPRFECEMNRLKAEHLIDMINRMEITSL